MANALQEYRQEVERQYSQVIVRFINLGRENLQAEKVYSELTSDQEEALDAAGKKLLFSNTVLEDLTNKPENIKREVCRNLLRYQQKVCSIPDQYPPNQYPGMLSLIVAILVNEQVRCNIQRNTAQAIALAVLRQVGIPQSNISIQVPPSEQLKSERGVNYIPLWYMLQQREWYDANEETRHCLVQASGQQQRNPQLIDVNLINVVDLRTIDALWSEFSNGHFGFKKQCEIWEKIDSRSKNLEALGRQLDWRRSNSWINYEAADFSEDAVSGHLPIFPRIGWWCWVGNLKTILDQFNSKDVK